MNDATIEEVRNPVPLPFVRVKLSQSAESNNIVVLRRAAAANMDGVEMQRCFDESTRFFELVAKGASRSDDERAFCDSFEFPTAARVFGPEFAKGKKSVAEYLRGKSFTSLENRSMDGGAYDLLSATIKKAYWTPWVSVRGLHDKYRSLFFAFHN